MKNVMRKKDLFFKVTQNNRSLNAIAGVVILVIIVVVVSISAYVQIESIRNEETVMDYIDIDITSYGVEGKDVFISFAFNNVSYDILPHLEVQSYQLVISGRAVVGTISRAVEFVDVPLKEGDNMFDHVFEGLIEDNSSPFRIDVDFVSRVGVIHLDPLYVL